MELKSKYERSKNYCSRVIKNNSLEDLNIEVLFDEGNLELFTQNNYEVYIKITHEKTNPLLFTLTPINFYTQSFENASNDLNLSIPFSRNISEIFECLKIQMDIYENTKIFDEEFCLPILFFELIENSNPVVNKILKLINSEISHKYYFIYCVELGNRVLINKSNENFDKYLNMYWYKLLTLPIYTDYVYGVSNIENILINSSTDKYDQEEIEVKLFDFTTSKVMPENEKKNYKDYYDNKKYFEMRNKLCDIGSNLFEHDNFKKINLEFCNYDYQQIEEYNKQMEIINEKLKETKLFDIKRCDIDKNEFYNLFEKTDNKDNKDKLLDYVNNCNYKGILDIFNYKNDEGSNYLMMSVQKKMYDIACELLKKSIRFNYVNYIFQKNNESKNVMDIIIENYSDNQNIKNLYSQLGMLYNILYSKNLILPSMHVPIPKSKQPYKPPKPPSYKQQPKKPFVVRKVPELPGFSRPSTAAVSRPSTAAVSRPIGGKDNNKINNYKRRKTIKFNKTNNNKRSKTLKYYKMNNNKRSKTVKYNKIR